MIFKIQSISHKNAEGPEAINVSSTRQEAGIMEGYFPHVLIASY